MSEVKNRHWCRDLKSVHEERIDVQIDEIVQMGKKL